VHKLHKIHESEFLYRANRKGTPDNRDFLHEYVKNPQVQQAPGGGTMTAKVLEKIAPDLFNATQTTIPITPMSRQCPDLSFGQAAVRFNREGT
jgi:hypothetical protein